MNIQKYLSQIHYLDQSIQSKLLQIEELASLMEQVTVTLDGMPRQKNNNYDGRSSVIDSLIDQSSRLEKDLVEAVHLKTNILSIINGVIEKTCNTILVEHYINGNSWKEIADKEGYSLKYVYRVKEKAYAQAEESAHKLGIRLTKREYR